MKKTLLITGANGFVGKNFIEYYSDKYNIIKITKESKYDILNLDSFIEIENVDVVLHLAAKTFVPISFDNPYDFYQFNINSTLNIAEFCRIKKVKKLIYLNSYMYGNPQYLPINEKHPLSFHSPYNKSKYLAEELLFLYLENITKVVSLRVFNLFGKHQKNQFLIPMILNQIKNFNQIEVQSLTPKRDYLYILDLIDLIVKVIEDNKINGIFNVGSGKSYSVREVINEILDIITKDIEIHSKEIYRNNEVMDCIASINKLKQEVGWEPKYTLKNGLKNYLKEIYFV